MIVEARDVTTDPNSDAWTTLPEADTDGAGTADAVADHAGDGRVVPGGPGDRRRRAAPVPAALLVADVRADGHDRRRGTRSPAPPAGWTDWDVDLTTYAGKKVDLRISVITDWGTLGLGVWVDDLKLTDGATVLESNDFETDLGGWVAGPPPAGTDVPLNGWTRRTEEFKEGGVVATDDTLYTGFGFEGINESARNEFMKRTLTHLGVLPARTLGQRPGRCRGRGARAADRGSGRTAPETAPAPAPTGQRGRPDQEPEEPAREREAQVGQDAAREPQARGVASASTAAVTRARCAAARSSCCAARPSSATKQYVVRAGKTATVKLRVKSAKTVQATVRLK